MSIYASSTAGIPHFILDLLVDTLIRDRRAIAIDAGEPYGYSTFRFSCPGSRGCKTLWNMTLVHRTWTSVARRGLWYRAVLSVEDLEMARRDLVRCQQLRELAIVTGDGDPNDNANTQEGLIWSFLQQSTNIKTLYIDIADERRKEVEHFLGQLSIQSKLERLWIMGDAPVRMGQICAAVSKMQNLKSLVLDCPGDDRMDAWLPNGTGPPPEKLRSVAILEPLDWFYVTWLLQPGRGNGVSDLAISFEDAGKLEDNPKFVSLFYECLPRLKSLHVSTNNATSYNAEYLQTDALNCLLSKATNLQCFTLSVNKVHVTHLHLPNSVMRLHIHKDVHVSEIEDSYHRKAFSTDDSSISSILAGVSSLSSSPCRLNALVISVFKAGDLTADELDGLTILFTRTRAICQDMQIALSFETRRSSYLGDIAENAAFTD